MSKIGYARVSTTDQHADIQVALLKKEGWGPISTETACGGKWERLQWMAVRLGRPFGLFGDLRARACTLKARRG